MKDGLTPHQKGDIIEHLIADLIVLGSNGALTTYVPISDLEGIDIIVNQRGGYNSLYIQVKGRFILKDGHRFIANIRKATFGTNQRMYFIFAYFDSKTQGIHDTLWLVPSEEIEKLPTRNSKQGPRFRFTASIANDSEDKMSRFKVSREELAEELGVVLSGFM